MMKNERYIVRGPFSLLIVIILFHFSAGQPSAMSISPSNVQAIAVYGRSSYFGIPIVETLGPNELNYNIAAPADISALLSTIEFSTERDCNGMGAQTNAYVYIKFKDGTVERYDLFGLWSHISKLGLRGICFFISPTGQSLFENYAQ